MRTTTGLDLANISKGGKAPDSRLNDAREVQDMVKQIIRADEYRAKTRAKLKGLVDGNAPYSSAELKRTGQSYRTNVNFREGESYLNQGVSAFYDVFSEVPTYATVEVDHGTKDESVRYGRIITDEFDKLLKKDDDFDYLMQLSQHEMVLYGIGPMVFEDTNDWRCRAVKASHLLVPDGTKSNVSDWTMAVIRSTYQVHELYGFIRNEEAAKKAGWDVASARKAIIKASPEDKLSSENTWEWYQQQIRNNDLSFSAKCDVVKVDHVYYREFPSDENPEGAISHCIIEELGEAKKFLFRKVGRYDNWNEVVHCLYYDKGDGYHHSVKGMGVKMFSALELKNRLKCSLVDSAVARTSIHLKPQSPNDLTRTNIVQMGPYSIMPPNFEMQQTNTAGVLDAPMAVDKDLDGLLQATLSSYRPRLEKDGNPRTATEIDAIMSQQSTLGKTQLNRYYAQLDMLFAEKYRRAINPDYTKVMPGGGMALKFQKACRDRGVPAACMSKTLKVQTTRSAGRGSPYARQAVMSQLMGLVNMLPEGGRHSVIEDNIAALAGWSSVARYLPEPKADLTTQEQQQETARENILFKTGGIIPVSSGDNHAIHAAGHLQAGSEAAEVLNGQQGVNPEEIATFLRAMLEHTSGHMEELALDGSRKDMMKMLEDQFGQLSSLYEEILNEINNQQQQQQEAVAEGEQAGATAAGLDPKEQLEQAKFEREEARRDAKVQADIQRKASKAQQDIALKDAKTAAKLMEA